MLLDTQCRAFSKLYLSLLCLITASCGSFPDGTSKTSKPIASMAAGSSPGAVVHAQITTPPWPEAAPGTALLGVPSGATLFVVISGNATCTAGTQRSPVPGLIATSLFEGFNETALSNGMVGPNDDVIFACYERLSPMMQVYDLRLQPQMLPIEQSQLDAIVLGRVSLFQNVVIIGHSYGGWKSMKLATSLLQVPNIQAPLTLITIDPISKVHCTGPLDPGCREAPQDFSPQELQQLNSRTRWLNAVQEPAVILGSKPIAAAHVNLKIAGNHFTIPKDTDLWQAIVQFMNP
jgi:hypothetical protein